MSRWLDIANIDALTPGSCGVFEVDGVAVAVFNLGGEFFAIRDACPHDGGELAKGKLEGEEIICPRHGARFSIRTGAVLGPPAYEDLRTYEVRISHGKIQVAAEEE